MAVHTWISSTGDFDAAASWDTNNPPTVGKSVLTLTANPANTETVTIDGKTYTFQTVLTDVNGNVFIGAALTNSRDNLLDAINLGPGAGTDYAASMTLHATVKAEANGTDLLDAIGKTGGVADTGKATTEDLANGTWDSAALQRAARWLTADKALFVGNNAAEQSAVLNLNQALVDIDVLLIGEGFLGDVGTPGDSVIISANRLVHLGKGTLYFDNDGISSPDTTDELIVAHTGLTGVLAASIKGGKITTIAVARGLVEIADTDATTLLVLSHTGNPGTDAVVRLAKTSAAITDVKMAGGTLTVNGAADVTNFFVTNATLVNESTALASSTLRLFSGLVDWNSGVTIVRAELYGGLLDFTRSTQEKVITKLFQFPDARFDYLPDLTTFTKVDMDGLTAVEG